MRGVNRHEADDRDQLIVSINFDKPSQNSGAGDGAIFLPADDTEFRPDIRPAPGFCEEAGMAWVGCPEKISQRGMGPDRQMPLPEGLPAHISTILGRVRVWVPVILSRRLTWKSFLGLRKIKFWIRLREGRVIRHLQYSCHYDSPIWWCCACSAGSPCWPAPSVPRTRRPDSCRGHDRDRKSIMMASAVSPRGELRFHIHEGSFRAANFIGFCKQLIRDLESDIFLIVDGSSVYTVREIKGVREVNRREASALLLPAVLIRA